MVDKIAQDVDVYAGFLRAQFDAGNYFYTDIPTDILSLSHASNRIVIRQADGR